MSDCLFCKIISREVPATVLHETDQLLAFRDIAPQAPVHLLVIPKTHYPDLAALAEADPGMAGQLLAGAASVARAEGLLTDGYRTIANTGRNAGQEVPHVHLHLLGGAPLGPMLARF